MENVLIKEVAPSGNGFFEVEFGDGRKASTRKKDLAEKASLSVGEVVAVDLTERVNGNFTNVYLNKIEKADPSLGQASSKPHPTVQAADVRNEWQARRWAYSSALELFSASGDLDFPPTEEDYLKIKLVAETILALSRPEE